MVIDLRKLFRLDEPQVLQQQLKLVVDNMRGTVWVALLLIGLVRLSLASSADPMALNLWCVMQVGIILNIRRMIRKYDRAMPLSDAQAQGLVGEVFVGSAVGATIWGSLLWALYPNAGLAELCAVYALMAVLQSGAVSTMSPVLPLFLAFMVFNSLQVVLHAGVRGIVSHAAVALGGTLFVATLLDQSIRTAQAARTSIRLRFENDELLKRVRDEHEGAERAHRKAELASAAKSRVLAAASHDLRQPVHAQGLFLELLGATELSDRQRALLVRAREAVGASSAMLATLFDYSRIEAGVIQPQREAFAVQPMMNMLEREFGPQADAKQLTYRSRDSALVLHSDPALVELILRNLISNAIRYSLRGGLLVSCRQRGDDAVLEVWDTGIGIAPEHQAEVFREFHQLDNPERDRNKGFGLGLAIVDGLARALGQTVSLRSAPQRGSVFRLRVPLAADGALPTAMKVDHAAQRVLDAHTLVIDDDETILTGMAELLQSWGCSCDTATTIEQALDKAARRMPDLLISDYRLREERTGLQAIRAVQTATGRLIPAVLVTGDTAPERLREAGEQGIAILHKPVMPGLLYRELAGALSSARTSDRA